MEITKQESDNDTSADSLIYLTGIPALNLTCDLETCGDWHTLSVDWGKLVFHDSANSIFGDYGIERDRSIPEHDGKHNVANHLRALLDLIEQGSYDLAKGMNRDFICNDDYTLEVFEKVAMLKNSENWSEIDRFMGFEYYCEWLDFKERENL